MDASKRYKLLTLAGAVSGVIASGFLPAALNAQDEQPEELDAFISEEVPIEENILPTSRPFNSVYGTERSILDTPRNVTIISREQLDAIAIKDIRDFSKLTSSSYTKTNFGAPSTPNLRGQEADLFVNGMRKGGSVNGNGLPVNFNSVESVNIVKGPAGVVYGTTNYLGGYADLITKKPYFDETRGSVGVSVGSYDQYTWNLDYSTPVSDKFAWRVSYEGKEWDGYWDLWKQNSQAIYLAATFKPTEDYTIESYIEYFQADYTENWGINRVTQDLVDNGLYLTNAQTDAEYAAYVSLLGNGDGFWVGGLGENFASQYGGGGYATIVVPDLDNPVEVDRSWKLAAPGDDSFGRMITAGVDQTIEFDNFELVNKTYFSWKDRNTFSSYMYSEMLRDNYAIDNRTEFRFDFDFSDVSSLDVNAGLRLRYENIWYVNHYFNEPVNFWDLTRDADLNRVPDQAFVVGDYYAYLLDEDGRGILDNWYFGEGGDTSTTIAGPFAQFDYKVNAKLSFLAGLTIDYVDGQESNPVLGSSSSSVYDFSGDGDYDDDFETGYKYKGSTDLKNYNLSAVYKFTDAVRGYATYNFSETYSVNTGGGFIASGVENTQESELLEIGAKFSLLDNKLFISTAYVDRSFTERNLDGSVDDIMIDLLEVEFNYQPNRNFFATMGYSYTDATRTAGFFASSYTIDRADETGGYYVAPIFQSADGIVDAPGIPEHLVNGLFSYKWDNGFGMSLGFLGWGKMKSGYDGFTISVADLTGDNGGENYILTANTAEIDFQYEMDLTLSYEMENTQFKFTVFNLTDEDNWDVNNSGYGNGSILARMPIHFEFAVKRSF